MSTDFELVQEQPYHDHTTPTLRNPAREIHPCCFYAAVCQTTGLSPERVLSMVSGAMNPSNPIFSAFVSTCRDIPRELCCGSPLENAIHDDSPDWDAIAALVGKDPKVPSLEVNTLTFLLEQLGYFVFISSSVSLDCTSLSTALKQVKSRDTKVILLTLVAGHYMFFSMEPCSSERASFYYRMYGLSSVALDLAGVYRSKPTGILAPVAWKLDAALNLNVF